MIMRKYALSLTGRRGGHLDFRQNDTVYFVGDGTIEKPTPENIGVDTKITFLSCPIGLVEIDGSLVPLFLRNFHARR